MTDVIGWIFIAAIVLVFLAITMEFWLVIIGAVAEIIFGIVSAIAEFVGFIFSIFSRTKKIENPYCLGYSVKKDPSIHLDHYKEKEAKLARVLPLRQKNENALDIYPTKAEQFDDGRIVIRGRIKKVEKKIEYGHRGKMTNDRFMYDISFVDGKKIVPLTSANTLFFLEGGINRIVVNKDLSVRETTCE